MRRMDILRFPRKLRFNDYRAYDGFVRSRLANKTVLWPPQAVALAGYMAWPNDSKRRLALMAKLNSWADAKNAEPLKFRQIQSEWSRVADLLNLHSDMSAGHHQTKRGGASIGKAITLANANAKGKGTSAAKLWECWKKYKDVAHLVAAAVIVAADARARAKIKSFGPNGPAFQQLQPLVVAMLMPDFVLSVALWFQRYGLKFVPHGRKSPLFDRKTLWRLPAGINLSPIEPPWRKIRKQDLGVLNVRRAGNRGRRR